MDKELLVKVGLTAEQIEAVLKAHRETISGNFITKHRFDEVNNELKSTKAQVEEGLKQIGDLKKFEDTNKELQEKITDIENASKQKDLELQEKIKSERKRNAVKVALLEDTMRPQDAEILLNLIDLSKVDLDETGKIKSGFMEQSEILKKEKAFLFQTNTVNTQVEPQGWNPAGIAPVGSNGGVPTIDKATAYGKNLAAIKLGMMGINKETRK